MKNMTINSAQRKRFITKASLLLVSALFISACGKDSGDGDVTNITALPTDDTIPLNLECENVGISGEDCILDDSNNPYARSGLTNELKFSLDADAPSATARFYLWGTALAVGVGAPGENQFYTALNLHRMWASSNSELTRLQALKAYRAYLDNYFDSVTFFEIPVDSDNFFPQSLNMMVGQLIFDPVDLNNTFTSSRLFSNDPNVNDAEAQQIIGEWGYFYDKDAQQFTRNN